VALAEVPPEGFPGDPAAVTWWQRKAAAADALVAAGAPAVPVLLERARQRAVATAPAGEGGFLADSEKRAQAHAQRLARVFAVEILGQIRAPAAAVALREVLKAVQGDAELECLAIEGLGRQGDSSDVKSLEPYIGSAPKNATGSEKRDDEIAGMLQNAAAEASIRLGDTTPMTLLIQNQFGGGWARRDAAIRLKGLTGQSFGYALDAPTTDRQAAIERALEWWKGAKATFKPLAATRTAHEVYARPEKKP
jgi:hypothetical protein